MKPLTANRPAVSAAYLLLAAGLSSAQDMPLSQVLPPGETWRVVEASFASIGGLAADDRGNLFIADPDKKQIWRRSSDGKIEPWATTRGAVYGLAMDRDGNLHGCQPAEGRIVRYGPGGKETRLAEDLTGVRHMVVTRTGDFYCTRPADNVVMRVDKARAARVVSDAIKGPTGLTLWSDEGTLVVAAGGGAHLWAFRIEKDGSLTCPERYYPLRVRPQEASDARGLTLDNKGRIYATSKEGVHIFDPTGRLCGVLLRPDQGAESAVAFGGPERNLLFLASGNKLYVRTTLAKGAR